MTRTFKKILESKKGNKFLSFRGSESSCGPTEMRTDVPDDYSPVQTCTRVAVFVEMYTVCEKLYTIII